MDIRDYRSSERFLTDPPIRGVVGRISVSICNVAEGGIQIQHADPLSLQQKYTLSFTLPSNRETWEVGVTVMWTRLIPQGGKYVYRSGMRADGDSRQLHPALRYLREAGLVRPDRHSLERKKEAILQKSSQVAGQMFVRRAAPPALSSEQSARIRDAVERLQASSQELARWAAVGRASLSGGFAVPKNILANASDLAVAVWEYLDHAVELRDIASVLEREVRG